jgi:hypothetical protein
MDQHFSVAALMWVHLIYSKYCNDPRFLRLLDWQLRNKGFVRCKDGSIKYKVNGRGMSGDMDTSLRNIVIMVCLFMALFLNLGKRYLLINDGDDNGVLCEREDAQAFLDSYHQHFLRAGFVMEVGKVVDVFELIDFCQTRPVHDGERYIMCRDPRIVLSKDAYCIKSIDSEAAWNVQRRSVSECGLSLAGNLPVLGEFYAMLGRGAGERVDVAMEETGFARLARGVNAKLSEPTVAARVSFCKAFGVIPDAQVCIERQLRSMHLTFGAVEVPYDVTNGLFKLLHQTHGVS